jgi:hypothetical protein
MGRYVVLAASVILFVLVTSVSGDTNDTAVAFATTEQTPSGSQPKPSSIISSVIENAKAVNLINFLPNPIHSAVSLVKEILRVAVTVGPSLPKLVLHPITLVETIFPNFVAIALIALTFVPFMVLPCKIVALLLSVLGLFSNYWAPFDTAYLALL